MSAATQRSWQALAVLAVTGVLGASACGPRARGTRGPVLGADGEPFACRERAAQYVVVGGIVAPRARVVMHCTGAQTVVEECTTPDGGIEACATYVIDPLAWDKLWRDLENLGWRRLSSCPDADRGASKDPFYAFEFKDDQAQVQASCRGAEPAFPFGELRDVLDRAAQEGRGTEPSGLD